MTALLNGTFGKAKTFRTGRRRFIWILKSRPRPRSSKGPLARDELDSTKSAPSGNLKMDQNFWSKKTIVMKHMVMNLWAKHSELIHTRFWTKNHNLLYFIQTESDFPKFNASWAIGPDDRSLLKLLWAQSFEKEKYRLSDRNHKNFI